MSVSTLAHPQRRRGTVGKLWFGMLALVAAGIALAWFGAGSLHGETTASGIFFRTIQEGAGPSIQPVDGVLIEYEARLEDGTVFDTSEGRGPTPMLANQVIPGFAEALTMMQKGGRYRVRIPSELGYGSTPQPGSPIPPNADLEFDVHVVEVVPGAALMQGMQAPGAPQGQGAPPQQPQGAPQEQQRPDGPPPQQPPEQQQPEAAPPPQP